MSRILCVGLVAAAFVGGPAAASAQSTLSFSTGAAPYDLSGVGTSAFVAARYEAVVGGPLRVQAGLGYFWYGSQFEESVGMLLPEVGVLGTFPWRRVPLYLAGGVGHSIGVRGDPGHDFTLYGAAGLDFGVGGGWSVRPELRVRVVDPWVGTIAEYSIGVARTIGG